MSHGNRKWKVLSLVLIAECMDLLDATIVNVAAPTIHARLHAGIAALQWIIGGYALSFAMGLVLGGRLGDVYGRRRLFIVGSLGFAASSALCAAAVDPGMLIGARLLEGASAALLIPQGLGIIHSAFGAEERQAALAWFSPVIAGSAVLGPVLGGALIAANAFGSGWRLIFVVNIPLGAAAALGAARLMPESRSHRRPTLDVVGAVIGALGMGLLVYPLIQGRQVHWAAWTFVMIAGSIVACGLLILWSRRMTRRGRDPLVEDSIFRHRQYTTGLGAILVFFAGMLGTLLVVTLYLQLGEQFSAIHAGLTVASFALGITLGAILAGAILVPRLGRVVLQVGAVAFAAGIWWLHDTIGAHLLQTTTLELAWPELLSGLGMGMLVGPLFDFILAAVDGAEVGSAAGVLNAVQQLAGALGVATIGTLFFSTLASHGYVTALRHSLVAELISTPVLFGLLSALPRHARRASPSPEGTVAPQRRHHGAFDSAADLG
ncbi:MAG TPA: MFS transporter [Solirubrobacteraceae bacterium]|nr:MFS transporter [Solirubrobacteraceae bacterium]